MNTSSTPWYSNDDYQDRHGSFFQHAGQSYFSSNDRSHSGDPHNAYFRDTVLCYVNYYQNGSIAPCVIDAAGVGAHNGRQSIEAEHFFSLAGARKGHDAAGRFGVHGIRGGATEVAYQHVQHAGAARRVVLRAASGGSARGSFTAWAGARKLCSAPLPSTGSWEAYADSACAFEGSAGEDFTLRLTFEGQEGQELARLDALQLQ